MSEQWKDVPGYEGAYQVSDEGRVRNAAGRVLAANEQNSGYLIVHLYSGSRTTRKPHLVHRLVLAAFDRVDPADVNHIDGNKHNNRRPNLERATPSENMRHAAALGLTKPPRRKVVGVPLGGGESIEFASQCAVEQHFTGRNTGVIARCIAGKCGSAYGYVWSRT